MPTSELPPTDDTCPACNGTGSITGVHFEKRGTQRIHPPRCPKCDGTGRIPKAKFWVRRS
jgi:DnaJ-class molecular chaperone